MKVGIFTIIDYSNYGNRLQNYALQEFLKSLGHETISILNEPIEKSKKPTKTKIIYCREKSCGLFQSN